MMDVLALIVAIIAAINIGVDGIFGYNFMEKILGGGDTVMKIYAVIVGLAGLWLIKVLANRLAKK